MTESALSAKAQSVITELRTTLYLSTAEHALGEPAGAAEAIASGAVRVVCTKPTVHNPGGERFLAATERETVWCEAHGGTENPHFQQDDCLYPHFTDQRTRARLNRAAWLA